MAETVVKTVENVDRLFSQIVVNGEVHESENYVALTPSQSTPQAQPAVITPENQPSPSVPANTEGEDIYAVELNNVIHNFIDRLVTQGLADETQARLSADAVIQGAINAITALIPSQATSQNQLADKNFVNSSIATNTANFLGTYTSLADIQAIQNPTNNDYAYLQTVDSAGNTQFQRYKYSSADSQWHYEYTLNNSSFTAEQWATINSGLSASSVSQQINSAVASEATARDTAIANAVAGKANISDVPTKTSQLQNDSGFVTSASVPTKTSQLQNDSGFVDGTSVTNEINNAVSGRAVGNLKVYYVILTPRQLNTPSELTAIVASHGVGSFICFSVGWEEYQYFNYAGSTGYIIYEGGSASAYGKLRGYSDKDFILSFYWINSVDVSSFSGFLPLTITDVAHASNADALGGLPASSFSKVVIDTTLGYNESVRLNTEDGKFYLLFANVCEATYSTGQCVWMISKTSGVTIPVGLEMARAGWMISTSFGDGYVDIICGIAQSVTTKVTVVQMN